MNVDTLREAFGGDVFTIREASAALGTTIAATRTILRDLRVDGLLERTAPGRYKAMTHTRRLELTHARFRLRLEHALTTSLRVGLDGPQAVQLWTDGRYHVADDAGIIHVAVAHPDAYAYDKHLDEAGIAHGEPGTAPSRRPGVILREVRPTDLTTLRGRPVLSRQATLELIRSNPIAYEGAEEWLR